VGIKIREGMYIKIKHGHVVEVVLCCSAVGYRESDLLEEVMALLFCITTVYHFCLKLQSAILLKISAL
jgi:hypothetical protein